MLLIIDLSIRHKVILSFSPKQLGFYIFSIIISILLYTTSCLLLQKIFSKNKTLYYGLLSLISFIYATLFLFTYGYFFEMSIIPNYYAFNFIRNESYNAWILLKSSFSFLFILFFGIAFSTFFFLFRQITIKPNFLNSFPRWLKILLFVLFFGSLPVLNNNIKLFDQCAVSDTNSLAQITRQIYVSCIQNKPDSNRLQARSFKPFASKESPKKYNVLFILGESLRKQNLQIYGYQRETTPFLTEFKKSNSNEFFQFQNGFSVATTTVVAIPTALTGISPVQSSSLLHSYPLFFDYAKIFDYKTFFISSQTFHWAGFDSYFNSSAIDYTWNLDNSGLKATNELGIDDGLSTGEFIRHISSIKNQPFAGLLHFNTNHYPYNIPASFQKWGSKERLDEYDNTILYQDHLLKRVFSALDSCGVLDQTIVIFTSDHGEAFKEHGFIGHIDSNFFETIAVPMFFYIPKQLQSQLNISNLKGNLQTNISNIDLIPSLIDIWQPKASNVQTYKKEFFGGSVFSILPKDRTILISNYNDISNCMTGLSSVKNNEHYILQTNTTPKAEYVFDFMKDPWEKNNLWVNKSEVEKQNYRNVFSPYPMCKEVLKLLK